jgi:hypothetical protein
MLIGQTFQNGKKVVVHLTTVRVLESYENRN